MYIVLVVSLIVLLLTYLDSKNSVKNGLGIGFLLLTILAAIHYNYGNDYMAYFDIYKEVNKYADININLLFDKTVFRDVGWSILCYLFSYLGGFFVMVAVLNVIQNIIVYRFIKKHVAKQWWVMVVFIYLFSTILYLLNFSMMRQGFIVCIFLGMWTFIKERKWWWPLIVLYLCSYIHSSAIVLLPFAFLGFAPIQNCKKFVYILIAIFIIFWTRKEILSDIFLLITTSSESLEGYADTYGDTANTATFSIGFALNLIPFFVSLYYLYNNKDKEKNMLVLLSATSFLIMPFTLVTPAIGRIGTYFSIYKLGGYPLIYTHIKKKNIRQGLIAIFILMTLYDYWLFFNVGVFAKPYSTFHTIFEVL